MSTWDDVMNDYADEISNASDNYIKATNILPYTISEIQKVFTDEELEEVGEFLKEMKAATENNERKRNLINQYAPIVSKLLKLAKIII